MSPGIKAFEQFIDYRPKGQDIILRVVATFSDSTGVASWTFETIDPETLQPTTNPLFGFLPPNHNSPEGQGGVFFTIKSKDGLSTNAVLQNKATIFFDNNPPIITAPWINTIDNSSPHSAVHTLPEYTKDTVVNVKWSGIDTGAGIRDYTIYVSRNGGPYQTWKYQTTDTAALFTGQYDSSYAFYSVATDNANNREEAPAGYDAITHLIRPDETITNGIHVYPNPTKGTVTIQGYNPGNEDIRLSVTNVTGQTILMSTIGNSAARPFKTALDLSKQPSGYYNLHLQAGAWKQVIKVIRY